MKKLVTSIVIGSLLIGGVAYANESYESANVDPEVYHTLELEGTVEVEIEEIDEQVLLDDENIEKIEVNIEENITEEKETGDQVTDENLEKEKKKNDIIVIDSPIREKSSNRGENLIMLLEREDLPATAKAGITKALANQERAKGASNKEKIKNQKKCVQSREQYMAVEDDIIVLDDQEQVEFKTLKSREEGKEKSKKPNQKK